MSTDQHVIFYHSPNSRSAGVLVLLEELNADYETFVLSLKAGEQRKAEYLAINPMGKVPAIRHGEAVVTEQVAIYQYLAELYPEAGLAPQVGSPLRGPFLRWLAFYGSSFEPALVDRSQKREPTPPSTCPYGDFDTMFKTLTDQLAKGPYILGDQFSAADVLWANALRWTTMFQLVPLTPLIRAYIDRVTSRPAAARAAAKDQQLIAAQA
ncbi:MAG: glutathione S-transferase family protein [Aquabacterium sp.]|uniref:glutathione S-transferase family protein n=1 Tax=Aquabacterium sp. TaxID=1872578 RepID=UPI002721D9AA|nr:glutathione S-transferase family protein [Aquabacterium sp.]MDO9005224.1 glutathione S-transferase family protein [Aquabacterium sp.]